MVELNGTQSSITLSEENDASSEKNDNTASDGYNLIVLLKSLTLNVFSEEDPRELKILIALGNSEPIEIFGTATEINHQHSGYAIG